jgi:outer membrane protein OmpA-like peptidoglycan-associated protein
MPKCTHLRQRAPAFLTEVFPRLDVSGVEAFWRWLLTGLARVTVRTRPVLAVVAASALLWAIAGCAWSLHPHAQSTSSSGDRVVVLVTGTVHEPRPMLTPLAQNELRAAAESKNVTDSFGGKGSVAVVATADDQLHLLPLTPRRGDGAVEYGLQRTTLIENNLHQVAEMVDSVGATHPGLDLLKGIDDAVRGSGPGVLIVVSNGLSTSGGLDLRQVGWNADPAQIARQLRTRHLLPDLAGWRVLFTGLGATIGEQPPMPKPTRDKLAAYWRAICEAAGALYCQFDDTRLDPKPPKATVETPLVKIPGVTSVTGPTGEITATLSDPVLGFAGDSAVLSPAAQDLLREIALRVNVKLADQPDSTVTIHGYTADPPESGAEDRRRLSEDRARSVAAALAANGVTHQMNIIGHGAAPGTTAMRNGVFVEAIAEHMRRVAVTY